MQTDTETRTEATLYAVVYSCFAENRLSYKIIKAFATMSKGVIGTGGVPVW